MYQNIFKRVIDITLSVAGLIILSPLLLLVSIAIYLEDRGRVIFKQERVGANGTTFDVLKFRSMPENTAEFESAEAYGLPITKVGRYIRRTYIDELPQLINILQGSMSLVGPRPPLVSQVRLCEYRRENGSIACVPGLTGLAQVNGYDYMPDEEKARWDGEYAKTMSLFNDARIVLRTFGYLRKKPPVY